MKSKSAVVIWNAIVSLVPIVLPLIVQHKDLIIKTAKKVKVQ